MSSKVLNRFTLKKVELTKSGPQITLLSETFNKSGTQTTELILAINDGVEVYIPGDAAVLFGQRE